MISLGSIEPRIKIDVRAEKLVDCLGSASSDLSQPHVIFSEKKVVILSNRKVVYQWQDAKTLRLHNEQLQLQDLIKKVHSRFLCPLELAFFLMDKFDSVLFKELGNRFHYVVVYHHVLDPNFKRKGAQTRLHGNGLGIIHTTAGQRTRQGQFFPQMSRTQAIPASDELDHTERVQRMNI
jgi:hypothetical protein